jgi:hypothetical protein
MKTQEKDHGCHCPVCGVLTHPFSLDGCTHFYGSTWDEEIMGEDEFSLERIWGDFLEAMESVVNHPDLPDADAFITDLVCRVPHSAELTNAYDCSLSHALEEFFGLQMNGWMEAGVMMAGSGGHFFVGDRAALKRSVEKVQHVTTLLLAELEQRVTS